MLRIGFTLIALCLVWMPARAQQTLKPAVWSSYDITFEAPAGITVEEDSEEAYTVSTSTYYISLQLLDSEGLKRAELAGELKHVADDDGVTRQSAVKAFELPQFYGVQLTGNCDPDPCMYCYLLAKDGSGGFYVSILYKDAADKLPEKILKSFKLVE